MTKSNQRVPGEYGPWVIKETDTVYLDPFIEVQLDQVVRPDQRDGQHVVVFMKPGACVLPIDDEGNVFLTSEFHYGIGRLSLEVVSGGMEADEDAETTARRELAEELGLAANQWQYVTTVDPFTTIVVSPTHLFVARELRRVKKAPEGTEQIQSVKMPLKEAKQQVLRGEITHGPTCILILWAADQLD